MCCLQPSSQWSAFQRSTFQEPNRLASVSSMDKTRTSSRKIDSLGNSVEKVEGPVIGVLNDHGTIVVTYLPTPGTMMIT